MGSPRIVLTASNSDASESRHSIWQQMLSATIPSKFSSTLIDSQSLINESCPDGRAKYVPNGLRMVETLLLRDYSQDDVVTCYVENLDKFVGPETRILAIHAHNPLGISYATDVYSKLGGENLMPVNASEFLRIVTHPVIDRYKPRIIVGGPGAWQLERANRLDEFRVDYLIDGEIERAFADIFARILDRGSQQTGSQTIRGPDPARVPDRDRAEHDRCQRAPFSRGAAVADVARSE